MWCQARKELLWQNIDGVCGPRPRPGRHAERERPGRFGERVSTDYAKQGRRRERIEDPVSVNDIRRGRTAGLDSRNFNIRIPPPLLTTVVRVRKPSRVTRPAAHARAAGRVRGPAGVRPRAATHRAPAATRQKCRPMSRHTRYPESALGDRRRAAQLNRPESYAVSALVAGLRSLHRTDQYHHPEAFQTAQAW